MEEINYLLITLAAVIAIASPGPATLAISGMSMSQGRGHGLALAAGVLTGSFFWSFSAAFGLGALMYANAWLLEAFRYFGACYLIYLAYKSVCSALSVKQTEVADNSTLGFKAVYLRGIANTPIKPQSSVVFWFSIFAGTAKRS
jgi:threonine/homoserine/homoserine lactone efflux protein